MEGDQAAIVATDAEGSVCALPRSSTTTDAQKLATAAALGQFADAAMASRDYLTAIGQWLEAVRVLVALT